MLRCMLRQQSVPVHRTSAHFVPDLVLGSGSGLGIPAPAPDSGSATHSLIFSTSQREQITNKGQKRTCNAGHFVQCCSMYSYDINRSRNSTGACVSVSQWWHTSAAFVPPKITHAQTPAFLRGLISASGVWIPDAELRRWASYSASVTYNPDAGITARKKVNVCMMCGFGSHTGFRTAHTPRALPHLLPTGVRQADCNRMDNAQQGG